MIKQPPKNWAKKLLDWYGHHRRDLPWRRTQDPYAIWVSEIMLQQTTVEAVIPYYEHFLKRFPTLRDLAKASEEEVLKLWSGLGYYSRARNLHKASKSVNLLPSTVDELIKLPGIGRYTAGAIASIAFHQRAPILDGNVIRVLSRLYAMDSDPKSSEGQKQFWKKAEEILPPKNKRISYGDFNQALMELGAVICSPEKPICLLCPIASYCRAQKKGNPEDYPKGKKKTVYRDVLMTAAIVVQNKKVLFVRRPSQGLLKDFWEVPMVEGDVGKMTVRWPVEVLDPLTAVKHSVLNRRLMIRPFLCRLKNRTGLPEQHEWIHPNAIDGWPMSSMNKKILKSYLGNSGGETIG